MNFVTKLLGGKREAQANPEISEELRQAINIAMGKPSPELAELRRRLTNQPEHNHQKERIPMQTEALNPEPTLRAERESEKAEKAKLAIEEKDGLYHVTIDGTRYVATK